MANPDANIGSSFNVHLDPARTHSLDSYEEVPTATTLEILPGEKHLAYGW